MDESNEVRCRGCHAIPVSLIPGDVPGIWSIEVTSPGGTKHHGGTFCLSCMIQLAIKGVLISPCDRDD